MLKDIELINFIDLSLSQKRMILSWRNNENIKAWMYTQDDISLENHMTFIETLKIKEDKLYFLVKKGNQDLGVIDFTNITKSSLHMGLYINPELKGLGKLFLEIIIFYSFEVLKVSKIIAEVFIQNQKAYELYKKFGFIDFDTKIVNQKEVICLELENEDR